MTTKYFNVKQGITTGNILLDGITGNITTNNANLGNALTANFFIGSGNNLSNIAGANVTGQVGNALVAGTVYTNAQPNITSVGTLSNLSVTGTITGGNLTTTGSANVGTLAVTGTSNLGAIGNVTITGGVNGQVLSTNGSGGLSFISISSSGISNGTSNVNIPTVNGNVDITSAGNTTMVITGTGVNVAGTLNATGNANVGNLGTAQVLASANVTAPQLISNIAVGTAPFVVTSTTQVANLNVATAGTAGLAVAVTGNAQGNITSVGTLTSLDVTGNISGGNIATAGIANVGTLIVTGATTFGNVTANYVSLNNGLTSNRSNVVVTTNTVIDQFAPTTFRTAKYIISASGDDGFQSVETLLVHDSTTAYITIYGSICSNNTADIIELSSNINGVSGNVAVYATGTSANLKVNLVSTYIKT